MTREIEVLAHTQRLLTRPGAVPAARALSFFGEHSAGWLAVGAAGAALDRRRGREWLMCGGGAFVAHCASVAIKRVVRRPRPDDPSVEIRVGTPSRLSFPSAHATSTTAAAVLFGALLGRRLVPVLVPPMLASRLVLGVHYPSDVIAGSVLGALVGVAFRPTLGRHRLTRKERQ